MKKNFIKSGLALAALASFTLAGCLKDKSYDDGATQSTRSRGNDPRVIEIGLTATSNAEFAGVGLDAFNYDTTFALFPVVLNTPGPAEEDINVTIAADPALVDQYNTDNGTAYQFPDATMYSIVNPGMVVTIPKGSNVGYFRVKLNPTPYIGSDWAFGYKIVSVDKPGYLISDNLRTGIVSIAIKNMWDGVYILTGFHNRSPYDFPYETEMELRTINGTTNSFWWPDAGSIGHPIGVGPGNQLSWYGSAIAPVVVFNPTTNLITNVYNQGSATPISLYTGSDPRAGVSRYEPNGIGGKPTIFVYWQYNNNTARAFFDTLVYDRPR
ncbi:MAG: DUF1735 domain-containing protein [Chitinophagaceae bacterium]|nr:MAG: DUF1735 domain-containing protein [Chitinophagaceae bacterium]